MRHEHTILDLWLYLSCAHHIRCVHTIFAIEMDMKNHALQRLIAKAKEWDFFFFLNENVNAQHARYISSPFMQVLIPLNVTLESCFFSGCLFPFRFALTRARMCADLFNADVRARLRWMGFTALHFGRY